MRAPTRPIRQENPNSALTGVTDTEDPRPLAELAEESLRRYFDSLNGHKPAELYSFFMREVEVPLFRTVMDFTRGNQSRAAQILGINRGTLRKKLKQYGLMY